MCTAAALALLALSRFRRNLALFLLLRRVLKTDKPYYNRNSSEVKISYLAERRLRYRTNYKKYLMKEVSKVPTSLHTFSFPLKSLKLLLVQ